MRHSFTARAIGAALTAFGALAALPALAQDATAPTPPAPANGPGPATQPPPAPGTALPAPTQPAPAAPAAAPATPPPNYGFQYNGLLDGYYMYQFKNPKNVDYLPGYRVYDVRNDSPTLSLAEVNLFANPRPNGFGYKFTLDVGDTANIDAGGGPDGGSQGEERFKNIGQGYATYALGGAGAGIDAGKFYSPFGYEVIQSNGNYNYSRSLLFYEVPFYHFGARIYSPSGVLGIAGLTATGYVTRALFNTATSGVQGGSPQPGFIGQLNYAAPSGKFTLITTDGFGKDKLGSTYTFGGVGTKSFLSDNDFTYNFNPSTLAGLEYLYLNQKPDGSGDVSTNGVAVYFRRQFTAKDAYALRVSGFDARGGGVPDTRPFEITATYEIKSAANFLTRFEYRHDDANGKGYQPFAGTDSQYPTVIGSGSEFASNQDTVTASEVFTF